MHTLVGWEVIKSLKQIKAAAGLLLFSILVSACSERTLEMGFLDKTINGKGEFTIDNLSGAGTFELASTDDSVALSISCDRSIEKIEAENPQTKIWRDVTALASDAQVNCATEGKASFKLPLEYIFPYSAPAAAGDVVHDFQIRWYVKNLEGETYVFNRTLSLVIFAPNVTLSADSINIVKLGDQNYEVSGTCQIDGGVVSLTGPFDGGSQSANCSGGVFAVVVTLKNNLADGVTSISVNHMATGAYRVFGFEQKDVLVDVTVPEVVITSPTANTKFTQSAVNADGTITVRGTCSEDLLPVKVNIDAVVRDVTCSSVRTFVADVAVSNGMPAVQAMQTDAAGNPGYAAGVNIIVDLVGPGAFTITGVRTMAGADVTADGFLRDKGPVIDFTMPSDFDHIEAFIKDSTGTTTICERSIAASAVDLSSCVLAQSTTYTIYAMAVDVNGNKTAASNNGFIFTTQFPVPQITRVYAAFPGAHFGSGTTVLVRVEYDRELRVVGGVMPGIVLNTGVLVTAVSLQADLRTLQFSYVVLPGNYAFPLGVSSTTFSGCTGCLVDRANDVVQASMTLPADAGANGLKASNVKVDALGPSNPPSFTLGAVAPLYTEAPLVNFTFPSDPDVLTAELRLQQLSNGAILRDWSEVASPVKFSSLSTPLQPGLTYSLSLRLKDPMGNYSSTLTNNFVAFSCPPDFVYVHNAGIVASPFCIGQYEAKNDGSARPRFIADHVPESLSNMGAVSRCSSLGAGYDLVTNSEWRAVADLIAKQAGNWASGTYGSGLLHRGNNQSGSPVSATGGDVCAPNTALCASNALRRTHSLPYGQTIWDFAGNAMEAIKDTNGINYNPAYVYPAQNTGDALNLAFGTTAVTCSGVGGPEYCGFGKIDFSNSAVTGVWRGGGTGDGNSAGVFSAKRAADVTSVLTNGGYRCVYHP
ncbi:hypothetical protein AB1A81_10735 [Bdellovibrio bacteriovorus]|uniref:Uncharacterized protein n=1 Tax=Bdellovibrio bacteriovorus (strain ATCC 15356 / DSM 50701 / NCIMB 9529 / HD100) TaxID=264462 RepID=Q6MKP5_BDEBA|nr:conserved hypothetical protein [Bdellovibrio bacteriovorus HD100]